MNCQDMSGQFHAYIDGELAGEQESAFVAHVEECPDCRSRLETERAFSANLASGFQAYAATIQLPDRMKGRLQEQARTRGTWRRLWPVGVAAAVVISCIAGYMLNSFHSERENLLARYSELVAVQNAEDDLIRAAKQFGKDPELLRILCAYLPNHRRPELLQQAGRDERDLESQETGPVERVFRFQRSIRKGKFVVELLFEQWSDGRVHIEHVKHEGDDSTTTRLDAGGWEVLCAQNLELCRQLEIVDDQGKLLIGLPLPSVGILRRESLAALNGGPVPPDLLKRLIQLRFATRVKSSSELAEITEIETNISPPVRLPDLPLHELREYVQEMERRVEVARLPIQARLEAPKYVRKLYSF